MCVLLNVYWLRGFTGAPRPTQQSNFERPFANAYMDGAAKRTEIEEAVAGSPTHLYPYPAVAPSLESDFCSACQEHAEFELLDGEWLSGCCGARAVPTDQEPPPCERCGATVEALDSNNLCAACAPEAHRDAGALSRN
jgi:hypothetical protein